MARIVTERYICDRCGKDYITKPFWQGFQIIKIQQRTCIRITYKTLRASDDERDCFGQPLPEGHVPLIERLKHAKRCDNRPIDGQISMFGGNENG